MKTIKILGSGCAKCAQVEAAVKEVIAAEHIEATVTKVEDIQQIMSYPVMMTPAIVVDEVVKIAGKVPNKQEILAALA
ncbi:redox-active disulfide protein 2 [Chloroherpeton thalassium ATCC 35110]|uniref:Redox-active disulfide protein 2 n=1 Tax=Chloroherpeton thalassium (strain ATCC 35110 / GB-78) TaxID=517418 RepID=B3QYW4_CHLT3|nr:thioredoxin family protein [Chloroherpeton thalassium]ACF13657.1 redox-active disulfide protein 2 [Chloroherpeton thalassium ATCC 35110]